MCTILKGLFLHIYVAIFKGKDYLGKLSEKWQASLPKQRETCACDL